MRTLSQLMDLSNRKVLVTGGAGGIGLAVGDALSEMGAIIALLDKDGDVCEERAQRFSDSGARQVIPMECDLLNETKTRQAVRKVVQQMDGLDILVHLAAFVGDTERPGWGVPFESQTVEAWDAAFRVNLTAAFVAAQESQEALAVSGHGSIIFFGSIYGLVGPDHRIYEGTKIQNPAAYGASKGGLLQLTRYLATLFAPRIRVNAISPGGVWRDQPESFHKEYKLRTPLARMAEEEDLKGAVIYLASDLSAYVTGQNLVVDGGWTAW